jgi:hypothetical protein
VDGHQRHATAGDGVALVHRAHQRGLREVALDQGVRGFLVRCGLRHLGPLGRAGDQLPQVVEALDALGTLLGQVLLVPGGRDDPLQGGGRVRRSHRLAQALDSRGESGQQLPHVGAQLRDPARGRRGGEQRPVPAPRGLPEHAEGRVADAAARRHDGAQERLVVRRVGQQAQVGQ